MADIAVTSPTCTKKPRNNNRKPLKQKTATSSSSTDANIMAHQPSASPSKENISQIHSSPKKPKSKASKPKQQQQSSYERDLQDMQEMLQKLRLEKEKTEEMLKERDEMLRIKEEELHNKGKEQEKLQIELKKLQKLKEFKPTVSFPIVQSLKEKDQEKKKKGDPEKKRPPPPYNRWCKDQWNEVKKENPDAEFKEISHILGAKWKSASAEEKKPYEERYQAEKEAYLQVIAKEKREAEAMKLLDEEHKQKTAMELLEQYLQFKQETEKENNKKIKKEKDPLKPKQPMSAFFLFSNQRRGDLIAENKNIIEVAKIAGDEWKNMTEKERAPYEEMAKQKKEKYMQEMEDYRRKKDEESMNLKREEEELIKLQKHEALQLLKKKEKTENIIKKTKEKKQKKKQNVDPNRPKKPASSFLLFSKEARKNLMEVRAGINNSTLNALVSLKWQELDEEERQIWKAKAAEANEAYKKELEEYNKCVATSNELIQ
ncbi:hypothetical protein K2173_022671 [Erythroxylum novogranatense]|uniref:HMG box domain-containing protein n=1 Tax=Erythroxylum novogranatense TaxID=1862640 RepID=A0AAV8TNQ9_9ROSI|nr:hypothetical protein K2173_022671 [Erythroxylum novogranatense]